MEEGEKKKKEMPPKCSKDSAVENTKNQKKTKTINGVGNFDQNKKKPDLHITSKKESLN